MGNNFYISDLHFGHKNAISFDSRPFQSNNQMLNELVTKWNSVVGEDDTVYSLGDMFWKSGWALNVMRKLKGKVILIKGNHDIINDVQILQLFGGIHEYLEVEDGGRNVVLCHYPIPYFKNHYYGWYHLYGHVHATKEWECVEAARRDLIEALDRPCQMYNVGCMMPWMDYTPRTLDEIVIGYNEWYNQNNPKGE